MSKKFNLRNCKFTFGKSYCQPMLPAETEDLLEVVHMRGQISTKDEDVVHIHKTEKKIFKNLIHQALKGIIGVPKTKRHAQKFLHSKRGDDGGLLDVFRSHRDLIIPFLKVEFGENCQSSNSGGKIRNIGRRVAIRYSDSV